MKKHLLAVALVCISGAVFAQSTKLDRVKAALAAENYNLTSDNGSNYVDLKQGEVGYVWKTFYKGDTYKVVAFSDDSDVKDMDLILEDERGNVVVQDYTTGPQAEVYYTPTKDIKIKVRYKNASSKSPRYESRCRMLISYLSGGAAALNDNSSSGSSGGLSLGKIDAATDGGAAGAGSTARYDEVKQYLKDRGYELSVTSGDGYVDLKQGEVGYVWKTFYKGDKYLVVTFSEDPNVTDMDLFLEDENGKTISKDVDASNMAVVNYVPTKDTKIKVRYKNTTSGTPNTESRCRLFIAYKSN